MCHFGLVWWRNFAHPLGESSFRSVWKASCYGYSTYDAMDFGTTAPFRLNARMLECSNARMLECSNARMLEWASHATVNPPPSLAVIFNSVPSVNSPLISRRARASVT